MLLETVICQSFDTGLLVLFYHLLFSLMSCACDAATGSVLQGPADRPVPLDFSSSQAAPLFCRQPLSLGAGACE